MDKLCRAQVALARNMQWRLTKLKRAIEEQDYLARSGMVDGSSETGDGALGPHNTALQISIEDAGCDPQIEIDVDFHEGRRRISLSLSILPAENAAFNHMVRAWRMVLGGTVCVSIIVRGSSTHISITTDKFHWVACGSWLHSFTQLTYRMFVFRLQY